MIGTNYNRMIQFTLPWIMLLFSFFEQFIEHRLKFLAAARYLCAVQLEAKTVKFQQWQN